MTAVSYEDDPRPVFQGDWATASPAERGRHGAAVQAWKRRHPEHAADNGPSGSGSVEPAVERDRAVALKVARSIAKSTAARDADRLAAAALLARIEEVQTDAKPPTVTALRSLSEAELEALVLAHC